MSTTKALDRLALHAVDFAVNNPGLGDGEFIALTAHVFNQDRQVQLAAAADLERIRGVGVAARAGKRPSAIRASGARAGDGW